MKCTTREACVARYGPIDFASRHWPMASNWLQMLEIPDGMFPNWMVSETRSPVRHVSCNKDMAGPLWLALQALKAKRLEGLLHSYAGCFNIRMVRGSNSHFSAHSYGLAIDLNSEENGLGSTHGGFYNHLDLVKCFTDQGLDWGGAFHGRKDPMHFSFCFE